MTEKKMKVSKVWRIALIPIAICFVIAGFANIMLSGQEYELIPYGELGTPLEIAGNMQDETIVSFDELMIVDEYATYGSENAKEEEYSYFLACFSDENDRLYYVSVKCTPGDEFYNAAKAYSNNPDMMIGDLYLPVCAQLSTDRGEHYNDLFKYYDEAVAGTNEVFAAAQMDEGIDSKLQLEYAFDTPDKLDEFEKSNQDNSKLGAVLCFVFAVCSIIGSIALGKKIKKLKTEQEQQKAEQYNEYYIPNDENKN